MNMIAALLDEAKARQGLSSDNALAATLDVGRARISHIRQGRYIPGGYVLLRLAVMAGRDPARTIAAIEAEAEQRPTRKEWLKKFAGGTAAAMLGVTLFAAQAPKAQAAQGSRDTEREEYRLCVPRRRPRPPGPATRLAILIGRLSSIGRTAVRPRSQAA